ncbi:Hpt domain-containing protein [Halopseudomonas phragmitis]|uniref:HPt domain-containing protein n=2 Tax=Pseudomonadaceae TaxID=135621 RepID=A0A1V0B4Z8_9GAMM|nr:MULTISPECIES: Hpt domain-containing protein [Pseudomonadaceae]AQZ95009.1 hypothetical protein BVH74_09705 [Halopseudomonas phragmitis]PAU87786.1 Hpt domain-containing protein [Pseudomonas sp. WN033]RHW23168.1 Hpt domain-containing protein [Pseudomonas jilinensis]
MPVTLPDLDQEVQANLRELMQDDFALLLATFRSDAQQRLHLMSYCLDCQDWEGFRQQAHSFKGSCGNIGARALEQSCLAAELAGQQADGDRAKQALADMRRCFQRLQPLLSP